jgi:hypothetical protein
MKKLDDNYIDEPIVSLPDDVTSALRSAAQEFVYEHGWTLEHEAEVPEPFTESEFFLVLAKHLYPCLNQEEFKKAKIESLKAQLRFYENE